MSGPNVEMTRKTNFVASVACTNSAATCTEVSTEGCAGAGIILTAHSTAASLAVHVTNAAGGTYAPLYDNDDAAIVITVSANTRAYELPTEAFAFPFFKLVTNAGTATVTVCRKS